MTRYKDYTIDQLQLPLSFEDFIPENHLVRVVNTIVDSLKLTSLYDRYKEGGCPAYHPRMMLKVMIYSFTQKTYSSRQIAKALRENINFMWIAGGNKPDFRTINRFRLNMKDIIEDVFYEVDDDLEEKGENNRITAQQVSAVVESIEKKLEENPKDKVLKKKVKEFKKDILPRKEKYEKSFEQFNGRNSYSKTDPDATFMRMKEDAMLNGQLKP